MDGNLKLFVSLLFFFFAPPRRFVAACLALSTRLGVVATPARCFFAIVVLLNPNDACKLMKETLLGVVARLFKIEK